ncbi:MAG: lysine--tRNA ligase [Planctomycetia bacterium]|nr:lysine--tRNA ligase [Planctomycetia bacterium]
MSIKKHFTAYNKWRKENNPEAPQVKIGIFQAWMDEVFGAEIIASDMNLEEAHFANFLAWNTLQQQKKAAEEKSAGSAALEASRREKLEKIRELGFDPWGHQVDGILPVATIRRRSAEVPTHEDRETGKLGPKVCAAGRIMLQRPSGKVIWLNIKDRTGVLQVMIGKNQVGESAFELAKCFDLGDIIAVKGELAWTRTGELTIFAEEVHFLSKSINTPPDKHSGLTDKEMRQRMRYVDLIHTEGVMERFIQRSAILRSLRNTLDGEGFIEVEGPTLHAVAGGAAARPFITHHNALDIDLYMRIAPELHLKRLLVGGMERVYEIGRVYRNEGIDTRHNPEFTIIEIYQAYGNYRTMMDLTEKIILNAICAAGVGGTGEMKFYECGNGCEETCLCGCQEGGTCHCPPKDVITRKIPKVLPGQKIILPWAEDEIDFTPPFARRKYYDLVREYAEVDPWDTEAVRAKAVSLGLPVDGVHPDVILNDVFEETVEKNLQNPTFVYDYPASICPLTRRKNEDPRIAERFELFVKGMELANAYSELNDPDLQEELFTRQLEGQAEEDSMAKMDTDFIRALRYGMPPAGGLGIGVDRLVMLLTNSQSIRDILLFPLLRPEE